jgi:hypothetical protein
VTPIEIGSTGRKRIFHVHHKPLYAAIGEPDSRNRRRVTIDRAIERLMILDGVLADRSVNWLGAEGAHAEGRPGADATDCQTSKREAGDSHPAALVLFTPNDAWCAGTSHSGTGGTPGLGHDAALHAPQPGGTRCSDSIMGDGD